MMTIRYNKAEKIREIIDDIHTKAGYYEKPGAPLRDVRSRIRSELGVNDGEKVQEYLDWLKDHGRIKEVEDGFLVAEQEGRYHG